jgi:uncharacterized protein (DUF362 family)/NAD-dependent dihydropyrimidine dehydrogenase PreA subunit
MNMSNSAKVALVYCEQYDLQEVRQAVKTGLDLLGGAKQFAEPDENLLVKVNMLVGDAPEKCVGPHPIVFQAVLEQLLAAGSHVSFGDSPGFGSPHAAARQAGLLQVADQLSVPLADFETPATRSYTETHLIKQFTFAKGVVESDGLISLCKMKSHALTRLTGAIKNQFGCIPGILKAEFHSRMPNASLFSQMLVDINLVLRPRLYIMDGIVAMEGNGPRNGSPRPMHVLLFSTDPVALDATVCHIVNLDESLVEPIVYGNAFGLGSSREIQYVGDSLEKFITPDFQVNRAKSSTTAESKSSFSLFMHRYITPRPVIDAAKCNHCGRCVEVCPAQPKALSWVFGKDQAPVYNYDRCIRCYCCQELCPHQAISVTVPPLGRLIRR